MNKPELTRALSMYESNPQTCIDNGDLGIFDGYGLPDFKPVNCRIVDVARLIGWQCQYIGGGLDMVELNELARLGRKRFNLLD